jgi:hypothetical protein
MLVIFNSSESQLPLVMAIAERLAEARSKGASGVISVKPKELTCT